MKMLTKTKVSKEVEIISGVTCNKCGEKQSHDEALFVERAEDVPFTGLSVHYHAGYYSKELVDMTIYSFSICEKCLVELFGTFKIKLEEQDGFNLTRSKFDTNGW